MMKKTLLAGSLAALTIAASAGMAMAQQAPRTMRADVDGDSRISQAEFVGQRVQRLTTADANRDGSVTPDEMRVAVQARMAQRADTRFARLDIDRDGSISRTEFDSQRAARMEAGPQRAGRTDRSARMQRGSSGMGRRATRLDARGPVSIAEAQTKAEQAFTRLDADRDGFLTVRERQAGMQAMREQRRERMTERRAARQAQRQASPRTPASE